MTDAGVIACAACAKRFRVRGAPPADCPACGEPLGESEPAPHGRRRVPEDMATRRAAERAVGTAARNLEMIRFGLGGAVILSAFAVLVCLVGSVRSALVLPVSAAVLLGSVAGIVRMRKEPVLWTAVNAVLGTPMGVLGVLALNEEPVRAVLMVVLSGAFWLAVPMAVRMAATVRTYPELYAARALRGESTGRHSDLARAGGARRRRRVLLLAVGIPAGFALLIALAFALRSWPDGSAAGGNAAEPAPTVPFETTEARWRAAWNANDVAGAKGFLARSEVGTRSAFLERQIAKRSWTPLPTLGAPRVEPSGATRRIAAYDLPDLELDLTVYWEWEAVDWVVVNWSFPNR